MQSRRDFLKMLGLGGASILIPKMVVPDSVVDMPEQFSQTTAGARVALISLANEVVAARTIPELVEVDSAVARGLGWTLLGLPENEPIRFPVEWVEREVTSTVSSIVVEAQWGGVDHAQQINIGKVRVEGSGWISLHFPESGLMRIES